MRYNVQLQTFVDYDQDATALDKQHFANFASKYSDLCCEVRKTTKKEKVSVLDDVDFQTEINLIFKYFAVKIKENGGG